jgi:hypothetical protein
MLKTLRAVIWAVALVISADKLADHQARGNREAIAFQREMIANQDNQLQRLFAPLHEEEPSDE